jgi:putative ABC transport system substrate-binding protein
MRRREFITILGGAAAAWPITARAQRGDSLPRVVYLAGASGDDLDGRARLAAFRTA